MENNHQNATTLVLETEEEVKPDKMRKITDFFRKIVVDTETLNSLNNTHTNTDNTINYSKEEERIKSNVPVTLTKKNRQTFLDLGQKNLISNQCPECLMHFNKSFTEDVVMHKRFHSQYLKGYNFVPFGSDWVREIAPPGDVLITWSKFRFYEIIRFDKDRRILNKLNFFLDFVHIQLGAETLTGEEMREGGRYAAIIVTDLSTRIVGLGLFEKCTKVFKSRKGCDPAIIELEANECENVENGFIGVSRIWVDEKNRSKGLASMILNLKCLGDKNRIAFSQPTPSGFAFAKAYQDAAKQQCNIYVS